MLRTSKLTVLSLAAAGVVALSLAAMPPAHARGGNGLTHLTTKFMMANGARFPMNTREEAMASQQGQLASAGNEDQQADNPGWFIELISICDHLKDMNVSCE